MDIQTYRLCGGDVYVPGMIRIIYLRACCIIWCIPAQYSQRSKNQSVCEYQVRGTWYLVYIYKTEKKNISCEIEDFVETHLCVLCVKLRSRVLYTGFIWHHARLATSCRICIPCNEEDII